MEILYHGVDLHPSKILTHVIKKSEDGSTTRKVTNMHTEELETNFIPKLTKNSYVCVEASTCTFEFVKRIEGFVKKVYVINPIDFKNIYTAGKKTDKIDAKKLANALKYYVESQDKDDEFPLVYVPEKNIVDMRKLFSTYKLLNKEIVSIKNRIHSIFKSNLLVVSLLDILDYTKKKVELNNLNSIDSFQVELLEKQLEIIEKDKSDIRTKILEIGYLNYSEMIKILISIKGVNDFVACALIADIGDILRFKNAKKLTSYLRSAPRVDSSNNTTRIGKINKKGRKLSFELLLQGINHMIKSSPVYSDFYNKKIKGKSKCKVRSAIIRKVIVAIYYMLKNKETFRYIDKKSYNKKIQRCERILKNLKKRA